MLLTVASLSAVVADGDNSLAVDGSKETLAVPGESPKGYKNFLVHKDTRDYTIPDLVPGTRTLSPEHQEVQRGVWQVVVCHLKHAVVPLLGTLRLKVAGTQKPLALYLCHSLVVVVRIMSYIPHSTPLNCAPVP